MHIVLVTRANMANQWLLYADDIVLEYMVANEASSLIDPHLPTTIAGGVRQS